MLAGRPEKLLQGVTAELVGNCGFSAFPAPADTAPLRGFANGILCGGGEWGWASARDYLEEAARSPTATAGALVGHGSLRIAVAGIAATLCNSAPIRCAGRSALLRSDLSRKSVTDPF